MLEKTFTEFPLITTERLILRKLKDADVDDLFFLRSNTKVMQHIGRPLAKTKDEIKDLIKLILGLEEKYESVNWAITHKETGDRHVGNICLWNIQKEHYRAELGYMLHPDFHGKGIMQEAVEPVLDFGFKVMKLHSVEAHVSPENITSVKLLERNKFVKEAHLKENFFQNGKFRDSAIYSLLNPYEK